MRTHLVTRFALLDELDDLITRDVKLPVSLVRDLLLDLAELEGRVTELEARLSSARVSLS